MIPSKIPLLFVRYAPGSAGNFIISVLQTSKELSCWDTKVEETKGTDQFASELKLWMQRSFQDDLNNHLKHEPHHRYRLDFFSSKLPRGNELSVDQFVKNLELHGDIEFLKNIADNKRTVMRLNKPTIPLFGQGNPVVNIVIDPPSRKWLYRTRYVKLFGKEGNFWISKENHPEFLAAKFKKILFQNQYQFQVSKFTFLKDFVIGEPAIQPFFNLSSLIQDKSNCNSQQLSINLSVLFDQPAFLTEICELFKKLNLGTPDLELIKWMHQHYYKFNIAPLL